MLTNGCLFTIYQDIPNNSMSTIEVIMLLNTITKLCAQFVGSPQIRIFLTNVHKTPRNSMTTEKAMSMGSIR